MKKKKYSFIFPVLLLLCLFIDARSQDPTFKLTIRNIHTNPQGCVDTTLDFDYYLMDISPGAHDPFNYGAGQLWVNFNSAVGTALTADYAIRKTGSDLPVANQSPTFIVQVQSGQMRIGASPNIPANNNIIVPTTSPGLKVLSLRLTLKPSSGLTQWNAAPLNFVWRGANPLPYTKIAYFLPDGQTVREIPVSTNNVYDVESNDPIGGLACGPIANFFSSVRIITPGQSVNFFDSTINGSTAWAWTFTGGLPSTSSVQNPTNIVYVSPGVYDVQLTASNSNGSNTITKTNYITVLPLGCQTIWQNTLKISDAGNTKDSLVFGTSYNATNGIDTCLGEALLPPVPPSGAFDVRFRLMPGPDDSKRDFRRDSVDLTTWYIIFQPSTSGYPVKFKWNSAAFPNTGFFFLKDMINGAIVNVNMRSQDSVVISNSGITQLRIDYTFFTTMYVNVTPQWNIVSLPLLAPDFRKSVLFPGAVTPAYGWNGAAYYTADTLGNGKGYWIKFANDTSYAVKGVQVDPMNINIFTGWNLIGPFSENIPLNLLSSNPPGIVISQFYRYANGYVTTDTLKPGIGYWVRTSAPGYLYKNVTDNKIIVATENNELENATRLEFVDNENSVSLYLTKQNQITGSCDLPPVPPSGIFDVRYMSNTYAEMLGHNNNVKINSASGIVRLSVRNLNGNRLRIKDVITGSILNKELREGIEIEIPANLNEVIVIDENTIPNKFNLSQNYPNPFNPVTTIKYQLPEDGRVYIVLYDVLGKEVATMLNEFRTAGNYQLTFDASNLSSGVYFYKMLAGQFKDIKRMIVVK